MFTVTCEGEVFFASRTVEQYLGFHQVGHEFKSRVSEILVRQF